MDLNRVQLLGRLTRDPEVRVLPNGNTVAMFTVATSRKWKDKDGELQEQAEFTPCVVFGTTADRAKEYLAKGSQLLVEGRLSTRKWEGKDGVKRQQTEIVVDNMIFLSRPTQPQSEVAPPPTDADNPAGKTVEEASDEINIEDIPF